MFSRIYNTKSEKMDYIELLDKYMQGDTSPEEEKHAIGSGYKIIAMPALLFLHTMKNTGPNILVMKFPQNFNTEC